MFNLRIYRLCRDKRSVGCIDTTDDAVGIPVRPYWCQRTESKPSTSAFIADQAGCTIYWPGMAIRFEKIWIQQCKAAKGIKRRFGVKSAIDYLIREKLLDFADVAEERPEFARELPRFLAEVWQVFNQYEIAGYVASLRPKQRNRLRSLLYLQ